MTMGPCCYFGWADGLGINFYPRPRVRRSGRAPRTSDPFQTLYIVLLGTSEAWDSPMA